MKTSRHGANGWPLVSPASTTPRLSQGPAEMNIDFFPNPYPCGCRGTDNGLRMRLTGMTSICRDRGRSTSLAIQPTSPSGHNAHRQPVDGPTTHDPGSRPNRARRDPWASIIAFEPVGRLGSRRGSVARISDARTLSASTSAGGAHTYPPPSTLSELEKRKYRHLRTPSPDAALANILQMSRLADANGPSGRAVWAA